MLQAAARLPLVSVLQTFLVVIPAASLLIPATADRAAARLPLLRLTVLRAVVFLRPALVAAAAAAAALAARAELLAPQPAATAV